MGTRWVPFLLRAESWRSGYLLLVVKVTPPGGMNFEITRATSSPAGPWMSS